MSKGPIWAVAAPGSRKPRFTREQIAKTALKIADSEGFDALSMRRVAEALGAGTMTLYYYLRTKEDLLALVDDALMGETVDACEPLPKGWRAAVTKLATTTRATTLRHPWALRAVTGARFGPNALRHVEQSLRALASLTLRTDEKVELLSIVDDYVLGHCASVIRGRGAPTLGRKAREALNESMRRSLDEGEYPEVRAMIGDGEPLDVFEKSALSMAAESHFHTGLDALLDGLTERFALRSSRSSLGARAR